MTGEVTWYNEKQGFGFITGSNRIDRLYFHAPQRDLFSVGQKVSFETEINPHNHLQIAVNVKTAN